MNLHSPHLVRSRHGIWYARIVVPQALRERYPQLPREIRRSTSTADSRRARAFAQKIYIAFLSRFIAKDLAVDNKDTGGAPLVERMLVDLDSGRGKRLRLETHSWDSADTRQLMQELLGEFRQALAGPPPASPAAAIPAAASSAQPQPSLSPEAAPRPSPWLSEAVGAWLADAKLARSLSQQTVRYTYEPALRVFRELLSTERRADGKTDAEGSWDIRMADIAPEAFDGFLASYWTFPARQGRRANTDARQVLAEGGKPQTHANARKNLDLIHQFFCWATTRGDLDPAVKARLDAALQGRRPTRHKKSPQPLDLQADAEDGYVAWTLEEIARIFAGEFERHCRGRAARYFVPLIGLHSGMRINEICQLRVEDLREIDGIPCLVVIGGDDSDGDEGGRRLKTPAARRELPIHPKLIELGLLEYARKRQADGKVMLFDLKWFSKDGYAKYPGRDFHRLTCEVGVWKRKRKVFHSFRATLAQALERAGLEAQLIDRCIGHAVRTTLARHYARNDSGSNLPLERVREALIQVDFGIAVPPWAELSGAGDRPRRARRGDVPGERP